MTAAVGVWVPVRVAVRAWMGHYGMGGFALTGCPCGNPDQGSEGEEGGMSGEQRWGPVVRYQ